MEKKKTVRVRFAPSPTGYLHVGSARTALFNAFFAKASGGELILRIEDTDKKRSDKKYLKEILGSLEWMGIEWAGKPYFQSKRQKVYRDYARRLLGSGRAYEAKGGAVAFSMPEDKVIVEDLIHGPIEFDNALQEDLVIMKSDGSPTYNFACVVDDADMGITHVIRGDDHISNTPKQIALYRALETAPPAFAHIPLILGEDKSRLSKRHGATSIAEYREAGYLPEAMVNYMALLGWSPGDNREIIPREELDRIFSIERVVKTSAIFDQHKLSWMNGQYIKLMDAPALISALKPYLKERGYDKKGATGRALKDIVRLLRPRMKVLGDFPQQAEYFFVTNIKYDKEAVKKFLKRPGLKVIFNLLIKDLSSVQPFDTKRVEESCRALIQRLGIGSGDLIHPIRVAITGRASSPGLFDVMCILGKEKTTQRLKYAIRKYCK